MTDNKVRFVLVLIFVKINLQRETVFFYPFLKKDIVPFLQTGNVMT